MCFVTKTLVFPPTLSSLHSIRKAFFHFNQKGHFQTLCVCVSAKRQKVKVQLFRSVKRKMFEPNSYTLVLVYSSQYSGKVWGGLQWWSNFGHKIKIPLRSRNVLLAPNELL